MNTIHVKNIKLNILTPQLKFTKTIYIESEVISKNLYDYKK